MPVTIKDIINCLDEIAPFALAESWDNVGLLIGDRKREAASLLVGLDPTNRLLEEALAIGADTVITHHPAIFKPLPAIDTAEPSGSFLETALSSHLTIIACHTNFDHVAPGVNDTLAELLGLTNVAPLLPSNLQPAAGAGMGRIGLFPKKKTRREFISLLLDVLGLPSVHIAGELPKAISSVALCGGSGSDFAETARRSGADVYLTAEIKHHVARWAEECSFCVIDGTHYATERPAVERLARLLKEYAYQHGWDLKVTESKTEKHPFNVVQRDSYR